MKTEIPIEALKVFYPQLEHMKKIKNRLTSEKGLSEEDKARLEAEYNGLGEDVLRSLLKAYIDAKIE